MDFCHWTEYYISFNKFWKIKSTYDVCIDQRAAKSARRKKRRPYTKDCHVHYVDDSGKGNIIIVIIKHRRRKSDI